MKAKRILTMFDGGGYKIKILVQDLYDHYSQEFEKKKGSITVVEEQCIDYKLDLLKNFLQSFPTEGEHLEDHPPVYSYEDDLLFWIPSCYRRMVKKFFNTWIEKDGIFLDVLRYKLELPSKNRKMIGRCLELHYRKKANAIWKLFMQDENYMIYIHPYYEEIPQMWKILDKKI